MQDMRPVVGDQRIIALRQLDQAQRVLIKARFHIRAHYIQIVFRLSAEHSADLVGVVLKIAQLHARPQIERIM